MKNKTSINLVIISIIIAGFLLMIFINYTSYSRIIKDDIKNISKLTSTNIYSEINNELTKPIFVSLTMANDSFVKSWLNKEKLNNKSELTEYLMGIKTKYNYNSVFLISEKTKKYYHYNGILKTVNEKDDHDVWYYDFIERNKIYELDIDQDEADNHHLTVFVNCKIYDEDNLLGVTGVGIKMKKIQELLTHYEDNFDLEAFLIDKNGVVQAHTDHTLIEEYNVFENSKIKPFEKDIISNKSAMMSFKIEDTIDGYLISRYIDDLNWYLLIKKDTSILKKSFYNQLEKDSIIILLVILIILFIVAKIIKNYNKELLLIAETDQLTKILNRRAFDENLDIYLDKSKERSFLVFILDIDNFKRINDTYGHILGDNVIKLVAKQIKEYIKAPDIAARWGGDEFSGIISGDEKEALKTIEEIKSSIRKNPELSNYEISISIGVTYSRQIDTIDTILKRADSALYKSKQNGRDQITVL